MTQQASSTPAAARPVIASADALKRFASDMFVKAGAPAAQDAQLSVEQAQRYARDMSQLLARSMAKRAKVDEKNNADTPAEAGKT